MATSRSVIRAIAIYLGLAALGFLLAVGLSLAVQQATAPPSPGIQSIGKNSTASPAPATDPFREGVNQATQAAQQTQIAKTPEEWATVAALWEGAIAAMERVPASSDQYATAQEKADEYQKNLAYARRNSTPATEVAQSTTASTPPVSNLSRQASQLRIGMTYQEVVEVLGRRPDTVSDDQIRQELGRPVSGVSSIAFDWRNDNPDCYPISVEFDPKTMTAIGWDEGTGCHGSGPENAPFGRPCSESPLCQL